MLFSASLLTLTIFLSPPTVILTLSPPGVSDVAADWETKKVVVTASDDVTAEVLLAKLMKWSKVSGKSAALSA